jgi:hypothetical protein
MNVPETITVRTSYLGPNGTTGSRMRAVARLENGRTRQITIPYPYEVNNPDRHVAEQICQRLGYDVTRLVRMAGQAYVINTSQP